MPSVALTNSFFNLLDQHMKNSCSTGSVVIFSSASGQARLIYVVRASNHPLCGVALRSEWVPSHLKEQHGIEATRYTLCVKVFSPRDRVFVLCTWECLSSRDKFCVWEYFSSRDRECRSSLLAICASVCETLSSHFALLLNFLCGWY